jgi:two-component system sensor histidine kinase/response regulator
MIERAVVNVLLVEDSKPFTRAVSAMLEYCTFAAVRIHAEERFANALKFIEGNKVDLVLLDLSLPDSHGLDGLSTMRKLVPQVPIVIMTGWHDQNTALEALKLGAQDYLLKGDVTMRTLERAIAFALERSQKQSLETERLRLYEEREAFMAMLTHDLKNPLIGANRILQLLAEEKLGPQNEEQKDVLHRLCQSNSALLSMIRNLIEIYRYDKDVHAIERENTDFLRLISGYLQQIKPLAEDKKISIQAELPEDLTPILADENSILRLVQNLIENAIKFTPQGGSVTIKLWKDSDIFLQVRDTGPGISVSDRTRLFQRFSQGKSGKAYAPGNGLGLYLCKQIVDAHNGSISCESEEDRGATFTVRLPVAFPESAEIANN